MNCQSINYILCPFLTLCSKMFPYWEWDTQVLSASATSRARSDLDERGILNKRHCLDTLLSGKKLCMFVTDLVKHWF